MHNLCCKSNTIPLKLPSYNANPVVIRDFSKLDKSDFSGIFLQKVLAKKIKQPPAVIDRRQNKPMMINCDVKSPLEATLFFVETF